MPKVSIREIDNTGGETLEYLNYTVLIPGPELTYKDKDGNTVVLDGLFTTAKEITGLDLSSGSDKTEFKKDLGYLMAVELLGRGLSVQYVPAYRLDASGDFVESLFTEYSELFSEFEDKGKYDLRFITIGGISDDIAAASIEALRCAGNRGDAVAVLSVPKKGLNTVLFYGKTVEETTTYISIAEYKALSKTEKQKYSPYYGFKTFVYEDATGVIHYSIEEPVGVDYQEMILSLKQWKNLSAENQAQCLPLTEAENIDLDTSVKIDNWVCDTFGTIANDPITREGTSWTSTEERYGKYGAIFSPYITMSFTIDNVATSIEVPAGFDYLACFAKYIQRYKDWFAMSGSVRGVSPYMGIVPQIKFGDADVNNVLQIRTAKEAGHIATNVVCEIRPYGNVMWGNRTMHPLSVPDNADSTSAIQLTASSFLNIRQLCCDIKKTLYRAARRFTFEPNSDALWYNFKGAITPLLDEMKANQGIKGYQIIKVKTNKKALLVARIKIIPIEAVEDFDLTVELTDSIEVTE